MDVSADDLELLKELGRGAYGVVEMMRHRPSNTIMAVKVRLREKIAQCIVCEGMKRKRSQAFYSFCLGMVVYCLLFIYTSVALY